MPRGTRKFWPIGATPGPLFNAEGDAGGGGGTPPAGAPTPEAPKPAPPAGGKADDGDKPLGPGGERALEAERTARKDLEREFATFRQSQIQQRDALAAALGLKPEETSDADKVAGQITGLTERLDKMTRDNLVLSVINEHPTLSKEDREVVSKISDEATMRAVAARLAEAAKPSGRPKADPPSNGGGSAPAVDLPGLPRLRAAYEATQTN